MKTTLFYGLLSAWGLFSLQTIHSAEPKDSNSVVKSEATDTKGESYYEKRAKQLKQKQQQDDAQSGKNYYARRKDPQEHLAKTPAPEPIPDLKEIPGNVKKTGN